MAGKLTVLVGAGILGSILAKEGRMPNFSDVISGAWKVVLKPIKQSNSASTASKPRNDALVAEVNTLREQLQLIASSRPMTIVTSNATGGRKYGVIIVIVAVGYGYVWWKGWKIPDFMFATKRGLSDACNTVAKQLDEVFLSLRATRNEITSKLDQSSNKFDDIIVCSNSTTEEVAAVSGEVSNIAADLQEFNDTIRTLETRMGRLQGKQEETMKGVGKLMLSTQGLENSFTDLIQDFQSDASRPVIEHQVATPSRSVSLPLTLEPSSPSTSYGSNEANGDPSNTSSTSGLTEYQKNSGAVENDASPRVSRRCNVTEITEKPPSPELPLTQPNVKSAGLFSRTISLTRNFKFK